MELKELLNLTQLSEEEFITKIKLLKNPKITKLLEEVNWNLSSLNKNIILLLSKELNKNEEVVPDNNSKIIEKEDNDTKIHNSNNETINKEEILFNKIQNKENNITNKELNGLTSGIYQNYKLVSEEVTFEDKGYKYTTSIFNYKGTLIQMNWIWHEFEDYLEEIFILD